MQRQAGYQIHALLGIRTYIHAHQPWQCFGIEPELPLMAEVRSRRPDGVIAMCFDEAIVPPLIEMGVPVVNIASWQDIPQLPRIGINDCAVGQLAAEHLLDRGFRHFAAVPLTIDGFTPVFAEQRIRSFRDRLIESDIAVENITAFTENTDIRHYWQGIENPKLLNWLASLPRPVGLFAANDYMAMLCVEEAFRAGRHVPEDIAVLGVDNDELHCMLTRPPISSIVVPAEQIGIEAAAMLDRLMAGDAPPAKPLLLNPINIVERQSTDVHAITDPLMAEALNFIRKHFHIADFQTNDILRRIPWSRRTLENRFQTHLRRSPHDELIRLRIVNAQQLLADRDLPISEIALRSGFQNSARLSVVFRRQTGLTPAEYRRRVFASIGQHAGLADTKRP